MAHYHWKLALLATIGLCISSTYGLLTCKDNNNKPVDWFMVYKMPVFDHAMNKKWTFPSHLYMDSNNPLFTNLSLRLNVTNQSVAYTVQQASMNHKSSSVGYIFYNDEKPDAAGGACSERAGHTKGVFIFDATSGVWLVHSVPKFPPPTNTSYSYPGSGVFYGQSMLCITLAGPVDVHNTGLQLQMNQPYIYDTNLPPTLLKQYPVMADVINRKRPVNSSNVVQLSSRGMNHFISFAKSSKFKKDLYADLVAPYLKCNMAAETWQHGAGNLPSSCKTKYKVYNIKQIYSSSFNIQFSNNMDHSKYALCEDGLSWFCIGDINRQTHQMTRGGGTVCLKSSAIGTQYLNMIKQVEACPKSSITATL